MRIVSVTVAIMLIAGPAIAHPRKPDPQDQQQQQRSAPVVLAAAETPRSPSTDSSPPAPAPSTRPVGRITHCRCGDPQPGGENPDP